jgi:cyclopropane-fatty-acyl-phospholipid synthase
MSVADRLCRHALRDVLRLVTVGELALTLDDGTHRTVRGRAPGPMATLHIVRPRFVRRMVLGGGLGLAESYMDGDVETEDLAAFLEFIARNLEDWQRRHGRARWYRALWHLSRPVRALARRRSADPLDRHYDLGDAFFAHWLDPSMTYSAAVYPDGTDDLHAAQAHKYRLLSSLADLAAGHRVLEIGCGWGGFAVHAAREIGCEVTALTLSPSHHGYARARAAREGVADRVRVLREDYRRAQGVFDRVVSIEMFEAVGERNWRAYFDQVRARLAAGGKAALQIIVIAENYWDRYRRKPDFIQRYIFPGGILPTRAALRRESAAAGLTWVGDRGFGAHYARTLAEWRRRFEAAWPELAPMGFDDRFRRMWRFYLAYCEAGFRTGRIDVVQVGLARS